MSQPLLSQHNQAMLKQQYKPVIDLNRSMLSGLEKLTQFQLESMQFYADFGLKQVQLLMELKASSDLGNYTQQQMEKLDLLGKQLSEDTQRFHHINQHLKSSVMQYLQTSTYRPIGQLVPGFDEKRQLQSSSD